MFQHLFLMLIVIALMWLLIRSSRTDLGLPLRQAIAVGLVRAALYIVTIVVMALIAFWIVSLLPRTSVANLLVPLIASLLGMYVAILVDRRVRTAIGNKDT